MSIATTAPAAERARAPEGTSAPTPGTISLGQFLDRAGAAILGGLPAEVWVEAAVLAVRPNRSGHAIELTEPDKPSGSAGTLSAFLGTATCARFRTAFGPAFDPAHLVGLTAVMRLQPTFSGRWHLQARVTDLSRSMQASLASRMLIQARENLRAEGLLQRQQRLPAPRDVTRLVVIHPAGAAGHADVEAELSRWQRAGLILVRALTCPFDGPSAAVTLVGVLQKAAAPLEGCSPDLVMLVRGGGAKAGLVTFNDEAVARAVASASIPILVGLGHATDRSLTDEVAWRSADTPSKAIRVVRDLIIGPARRAMADHETIERLALDRADRAARDLAALRERTIAAGEMRLAQAKADMDSLWGKLHAAAISQTPHLDRLGHTATERLQTVLGAAPLILDRAERRASLQTNTLIGHARAACEALDDGAVAWGSVLARAAALVEAQHHGLTTQIDRAAHAAYRRTELHAAALDAAEILLASLDHRATLARGFALATNHDGTPLPTRAAALAAGTFSLTFRDGALAVVVAAPQSTSTSTKGLP